MLTSSLYAGAPPRPNKKLGRSRTGSCRMKRPSFLADELHDRLVARFDKLLADQAVMLVVPQVDRVAGAGDAELVTGDELVRDGKLFGADVLQLAGLLLPVVHGQERHRFIVKAGVGELPETRGPNVRAQNAVHAVDADLQLAGPLRDQQIDLLAVLVGLRLQA